MANAFVDSLLRTAAEDGLAKAAAEFDRGQAPYFGPSDEPLSWDKKGVVRLDHAIMALHLVAARIALRSVPLLIRLKIQAMAEAATKYLAEKASLNILQRSAPGLAKVAIFFWRQALDIFLKSKREAEIEKAVRNDCLRAMRDVLKMKMQPKKNRVRRTKRIASRNPKNGN